MLKVLARAGKRLCAVIMLGLGALPIVDRAQAIEEPKYTVVIKEDQFEIREYASYLVAETIVEGEFSEVGNEGFRRLFKFISGENRLKQPIAMTAPVGQEASAKIEMTAPVQQQQEAGRWRVSFVMPSEYTLETIPQPMDERISIRQAPGGLVAAVRYSGTWSRKRYEEKRVLLEEFIRKQGLEKVGEPVFARYNPPFTPWFLRRNEILAPVKQK
jgi:hypothetical protein